MRRNIGWGQDQKKQGREGGQGRLESGAGKGRREMGEGEKRWVTSTSCYSQVRYSWV